MTAYNYNSVFADFLSVTYNPDDFNPEPLKLFLCSCGYEMQSSGESLLLFRSPVGASRGLFRIDSRTRFVSVTASGKALAYLRELSQFNDYLLLLAEYPLNVTRLDVSLDRDKDFPIVRRCIQSKYPNDRAALSRKESVVTYDLSKRDDGQKSGSVYIGGERDQVRILIYDKTTEMLSKFGIALPAGITRYEVKLRSTTGISLKDAAEPSALFWHYGTAMGLKVPEGVSRWVSGGEFTGWIPKKLEPKLPYRKLSEYIEKSPAISSMLVLADALGSDGRKFLLSALSKRILTVAPST